MCYCGCGYEDRFGDCIWNPRKGPYPCEEDEDEDASDDTEEDPEEDYLQQA